MRKNLKTILLLFCLCIGLLSTAIAVHAAETENPQQKETEAVQTEVPQTEVPQTEQPLTEVLQTEQPQTEEALTDVRKAPKEEGKWKKKKGKLLFRKSSGELAKDEWLNIKGKIYCFDEKGKCRTGWYSYQGQKYYFSKKGILQTGWQKIGKSMFFFRRNGTLVTGEWKKSSGNYYYLKEKGRMAKGWLKLGKKKYYLDENGARVTGDYYIGTEGYHFSKKGVYQPKVKVKGVNPNLPMIALTFDDGPGPYTDRLLNCLEKYNARATFFVVGSSVGNYPATVKRAFDLGCDIGNHTWNHPQLTSLGADGIASQISTTDQAVKNATGQSTTLLRPPYGAYNSAVTSVVPKPIIFWEIDTLDWKTRNVQSTINSVLGGVKDGSIVLMHDIHLPTVEAVEYLVPELQKRGYQLVTVNELAKYKGQPLQNGTVYSAIR